MLFVTCKKDTVLLGWSNAKINQVSGDVLYYKGFSASQTSKVLNTLNSCTERLIQALAKTNKSREMVKGSQ